MGNITINLEIAGRTYPINVKETEHENMLKLADGIKAHMKHLRDNYAIKDSQDILAMTLLEYASRLDGQQQVQEEEKSLAMLQELEGVLDNL